MDEPLSPASIPVRYTSVGPGAIKLHPALHTLATPLPRSGDFVYGWNTEMQQIGCYKVDRVDWHFGVLRDGSYESSSGPWVEVHLVGAADYLD